MSTKTTTLLRWLVAGVLVILLGSCASPSYEVIDPDRPHHTATGFRNLYIEPKKASLLSFLWMKNFGDDVWVDNSGKGDQIPQVDLRGKLAGANRAKPRVTWIGHSTALIEYRGVTILTDPVFSNRVSPFSFAGPVRITQPALSIEELPPIDYVLISHNHYDHLDVATVEALGNGPTWLVPLRYKSWFADVGVDNVIEFDW